MASLKVVLQSETDGRLVLHAAPPLLSHTRQSSDPSGHLVQVGIELFESFDEKTGRFRGTCDGSHEGRQYFSCEEIAGLLRVGLSGMHLLESNSLASI